MKSIRAARLTENAILPTRKHPEDAGMDFYSCEEKLIPPHSFATVRTGITMEIPQGYVALVRLKSRSSYMLGAGVIDAGYQGEIMIKILNPTESDLLIESGQAIAQVLIIPIETPSITEIPVSEIHQLQSARGATGGILEDR